MSIHAVAITHAEQVHVALAAEVGMEQETVLVGLVRISRVKTDPRREGVLGHDVFCDVLPFLLQDLQQQKLLAWLEGLEVLNDQRLRVLQPLK